MLKQVANFPVFSSGIVLLCAGGWMDTGVAAEVRLKASAEQTYVGMPITVQIQIDQSKYHDPPKIKPVDGLQIVQAGRPSIESRADIFRNGERVRRILVSSIVYTYRITPQRAGEFTVPPVKVVADGVSTVTRALKIDVLASETGDLLAVEIDTQQKSVYVGQPLEMTLRILVKRFGDKELDVKLSESDMWRLIRTESDWGIFSERIDELNENRQRPSGELVIRKDDSGNPAEYFAYEIDATIYPKKAGQIDGSNVRVIAHYPVKMDKQPDPFGDLADDLMRSMMGGRMFAPRLGISEVRPVRANAELAAVQVKPIPKADRPDDYRGAVGRYKIITEAPQRTCNVGDPIQLMIAIDGDGPMDLVRAPPIADLKTLTDNFIVVDEPLPGFVDGDRKVFATTIRPKRADVNEVPAIPYTFFDPMTEQFVTVKSEPITIGVHESEVLTLDTIVSSATPDSGDSESGDLDTQQSSDRFDANALLITQPTAKPWTLGMTLLLCVPPLVAFLSQLVLNRTRLASMFQSFTTADRQLRRRLDRECDHQDVASALQTFLSRVTGTPDQLLAIGKLRSAGFGGAAIAAERVYAKCQRESDSIDNCKKQALLVCDSLDGYSQRRGQSGTKKTTKIVKRVTASLVAWTLISLVYGQPAIAENPIELTAEQATILLREAGRAMERAKKETSDQENAVAEFSLAAEKYRLVIDSGISNAELHFYAGEAFAGANQRGRAIAEFRRALRIDPANFRYRRALARQSRIPIVATTYTTLTQRLLRQLKSLQENVIKVVPLNVFYVVCAASWIGLWTLLAFRWAKRINSVWIYASLAVILAITSGWIYVDSVRTSTLPRRVVVVTENLELRQSDDLSRPIANTISDAEGMVISEDIRRNGWVRVVGDRANGWVRASDVESI